MESARVDYQMFDKDGREIVTDDDSLDIAQIEDLLEDFYEREDTGMLTMRVQK